MTRTRLSETGHVYVTHSASKQYADACGIMTEAARRELTLYLLDATRSGHEDEPNEPALWRFRRGSAGVDISARVVREGPLAVVVSVSVRSYRGGRR